MYIPCQRRMLRTTDRFSAFRKSGAGFPVREGLPAFREPGIRPRIVSSYLTLYFIPRKNLEYQKRAFPFVVCIHPVLLSEADGTKYIRTQKY